MTVRGRVVRVSKHVSESGNESKSESESESECKVKAKVRMTLSERQGLTELRVDIVVT